jgi:hypothetical protein
MVGRRIESASDPLQFPLPDQTPEVISRNGQTLQIGRPYNGLLDGE